MNKKLAYLRDRVVNAYWMLREGRFHQVVDAILVELRHRVEAFNTWRRTRKEIPESKVPWSRFVNRRKVIPASYRPTVARRLPEQPLCADRAEVTAELRRLLTTFRLPTGVDE